MGSEHMLCLLILYVVLCTPYVVLYSLLGLPRYRMVCRNCEHLEVVFHIILSFVLSYEQSQGMATMTKQFPRLPINSPQMCPPQPFLLPEAAWRQRAVSLSTLLVVDIIRNLMM